MEGFLAALAFVLLGPIFGGLCTGVDRVITARMQSRVGPPILQPFHDVAKLFRKDLRQVNPIAEPLLVGHVGFMAAAGALYLAGTDLLFIAFVFATAALCLVLAAASAASPWSHIAAERELVVMLATEPFFILLLAAVCKATGAWTLPGVLASPVPVALHLPGALLAFLFVGTVKLRKSPFDISISHHPHQELVRGLTSDMSGRLIAWVELAHWYEATLLCAFTVLFFNWSIPLAIVAFLAVYGLEILVDNSTSRAKWQLVLRSSWAVTLLFAGTNLVALFLLGAS